MDTWNWFSAGKTKKKFDDFLLTEYANLAQAFFSAASGITQFFQYYLLALGVPLTAAGVILRVSTGSVDLVQLVKKPVSILLGSFFLLVGLVGFGMALYIINLRLDALLYARAVNGIRRYFYDNSPLSSEEIKKYRVLPALTTKPAFFELRFFFPVVTVFGILNSTYLSLGLFLLTDNWWLLWIVFALSMTSHFGTYWYLAEHRNKEYSS